MKRHYNNGTGMIYEINDKEDFDLQKGQQLFAKALAELNCEKTNELMKDVECGILFGMQLTLYTNNKEQIEKSELFNKLVQKVQELEQMAERITLQNFSKCKE